MKKEKNLVLRGKTIREDENGLFSLEDIYRASGLRKKKLPHEWYAQQSVKELVIATHEREHGSNAGYRISRVLKVHSKDNGGYWAHPVLAVDYAGYLKPELAVEVREVWLRYRSGDPKLADEVLARSSAEANQWAGTRALSRAKRIEYTGVLQEHGVEGMGYATCTNGIYRPIFGKTAKQILVDRCLPKSANLRDNMSTDELVTVMFAEMLAGQRIQNEDAQGTSECYRATKRSAERVKRTLDEERKDTQPRLG